MAARENTGLQAALIIFVMLTIGLSISTYMYFRAAEESEKSDIAKSVQIKDQNDKYVKLDQEARALKYMLGYETQLTEQDFNGMVLGLTNSAITTIAADYAKDMTMYGKGIERPNYRTVPAELLKVIKAKSDELVTVTDEQKKLAAQLESVRKEREDGIQKAVAAQQASAADLTKRTAEFETERGRMKDDGAKLLAQKTDLQNKRNELDQKIKDLEATHEAVIVKKDRLIANQKEELITYRENENFEVPSGKISYVNQRSRSVLINLGSADGLRPQISFSVYDKAETSATKSEKKAGIEVIRVMDAHLSEARIVHDKTDNPILPGDYIYTPVWQPGRRLHFALTGFMDIDGDGSNDRELVRNLILLNDGLIDAEQGDDGKVEVAKMTLQTRYLVEGELPTDKQLLDTQLVGRNTMIGAAQQLGIERISVQKLLKYLGWQNEHKTVTLGKGASEDVTKPAGAFRARQPAGAGPK